MNNMEKLTGEQILAIVEENYRISDFGFDELTETDVELTEQEETEAKEVGLKRKEYYDSIQDEISDLNYKERKQNEKFQKWSSMPTEWDHKRDCITNKLGLGKVVEIEQYGGEDQGSTWYSIKYFVDHDVYIRTDGYYQSYSGTDFHDGYGRVVTPQQKTITVFE